MVTLEGIALSADEDFNMYNVAAPFARRKILNPTTPEGRSFLTTALTTPEGRAAMALGLGLGGGGGGAGASGEGGDGTKSRKRDVVKRVGLEVRE